MFRSRLAETAAAVQTHLDGVIAPMGDLPVVQAMRYASAGGKRLRAFLVLESAQLHDIPQSQAIWPAAAIEAMHAYSLVHDDLPCMDDDDMRRGQPTVHVKWDYATAVLAGDALQTMAFELVSHAGCSPVAEVRANLVHSFARAAGASGMVLGQALDMAAETAETPLTLDEIIALQEGKTGALISWSAQCGARLAQAETAPLELYAKGLGLAFQIWDDVLDIEGDVSKVGKTLGKDTVAGKATFVSLLGMEAAKARARALIEESCTALDPYGPRADTLREAARFVISRES
ncbi:polyprenyl synthetase family protein [Cognatishimia sp. SS12]|uniref:polyprenyl synthetase family protein n=1 Tax=Cognatishimia sp. SS12 TaxID=2979465 RepID=UPI00232AE4EF|nr:farnesyl diphosphate synthase [Cognatishimia sp. SS12]MDC0737819.1 polyprenyl synthetase family protein [Cognatishimia sp. SS12]